MARKIIIYFLLINIPLTSSFSQEVITGLRSNPAINKKVYKNKDPKSVVTVNTIPVSLPFFDDFSGNDIFPDTSKWSDDYAFINNTFSDKQITMGMATLDALDNYGKLYATASSSGFSADTLTSRLIDLNYPASENIWLSFFYQSGGLSDIPEANDSLILQFLAPEDTTWYSVWKAPENSDTAFKLVMLNINEVKFLKLGFRFRFINYASLSTNLNDQAMLGNCDIWNIDYVMLDKNRSSADTIFPDVAMTLPLRSLLKNYEAMPSNHFWEKARFRETDTLITVHFRNNDIETRNITFAYKIDDIYKNITVVDTTENEAINPSAQIDSIYNAEWTYPFDTENRDSSKFKIKFYIIKTKGDKRENDTIVYYQVFNNFFAYDDGSSEGGYGINGLGAENAMVAYRFEAFLADTLRAISISFNSSYNDKNIEDFDLMVWGDDNGIPGDIMYTVKDKVAPEKKINGFHTYILPKGIMVNGPFYVGWKQLAETFLNVGYDINTQNNGRLLYWLNGGWHQSQIPGVIMVRAVVGDPLNVTGVEDVYYHKPIVKIWPNPATNYFYIDLGDLSYNESSSFFTITDLYGREVLKAPIRSEQTDISHLSNGLYIVTTFINDQPAGYNKLIKTR